jgi:hypothetical protein
MPWGVKKEGDEWAIVRSDTGKVVGHSSSRTKAQASVRARYWGASKAGEKLGEPEKMHELEKMAILCIELNELAETGWAVQTIIFSKDSYPTREKALAKAKDMGFAGTTSRETGDEDQGSWRIQQDAPEKFSEFRTQKVNDSISLVHGKLKK